MTHCVTCVFCAIAAGTARAHRILTDGPCIAFLDARPLFSGHVLVIPREHRSTFADLSPDEISAVFGSSQRIARAIEVALDAHGVFVAINDRVSQSVPHLHVHVVPRRQGDGLRGFFWPRHPYESDEQAEGVAKRIRDALSAG
jgi:histidine triad (HIT) family protein